MKKTMNPINFNTKFLIENTGSVSVEKFLKIARIEFKKFIINSNQKLGNINIGLTFSKTGFGGLRLWFICPICKSRVGKLYQYPLNNVFGCRKCLNLEYKSRKYKSK